MNINNIFYGKNILENLFLLILYISWILYFSVSISEIYFKKFNKYLNLIKEFLKLFISLFLIIKFNPIIKNNNFSSFDRIVVFKAGLFLFSTTLISSITNYIVSLTNI